MRLDLAETVVKVVTVVDRGPVVYIVTLDSIPVSPYSLAYNDTPLHTVDEAFAIVKRYITGSDLERLVDYDGLTLGEISEAVKKRIEMACEDIIEGKSTIGPSLIQTVDVRNRLREKLERNQEQRGMNDIKEGNLGDSKNVNEDDGVVEQFCPRCDSYVRHTLTGGSIGQCGKIIGRYRCNNCGWIREDDPYAVGKQ